MERTGIRWLGIAGSLRAASHNRALLATAVELAPVRLDTFDLAEVPLYNQDLDTDERRPEPVQALKAAIHRTDGLLIACPEYNYSVPGVLKNAIDWASRPAFDAPLTRKPVAIIGASPSKTGSARAQTALRTTLLGCACVVYPAPDFAVDRAGDKFDDGRLVDAKTRERLSAFLADYAAFTGMIAHARAERMWPTEDS